MWLRSNGYKDVANLIDQVTEEWKIEGKSTRRNWWEVLAGGDGGRPFRIAGRVFPVLRVAQRRQGRRITKNAIQRAGKERAPRVRKTARW